MDKGAWWATVHGVVKSRTQLRCTHAHFWATATSLCPLPPSSHAFSLWVCVLSSFYEDTFTLCGAHPKSWAVSS